jgi:hypothetical protein
LRCVVVLQFTPRNELSQLDPPIVTREFAAKRQEEVFKRELLTMLTPIHVENSGPLLGSDQPVHAQSTVRNCQDPLHCSGSALIQEALCGVVDGAFPAHCWGRDAPARPPPTPAEWRTDVLR